MPLYFFASRCFSIFQRNYGFALLPLTPLMCSSTAFLRFSEKVMVASDPSPSLSSCAPSLKIGSQKNKRFFWPKAEKGKVGKQFPSTQSNANTITSRYRCRQYFTSYLPAPKNFCPLKMLKEASLWEKCEKNPDIVSTCGMINPSSKSYQVLKSLQNGLCTLKKRRNVKRSFNFSYFVFLYFWTSVQTTRFSGNFLIFKISWIFRCCISVFLAIPQEQKQLLEICWCQKSGFLEPFGFLWRSGLLVVCNLQVFVGT